jgi:hypothetical protein
LFQLRAANARLCEDPVMTIASDHGSRAQSARLSKLALLVLTATVLSGCVAMPADEPQLPAPSASEAPVESPTSEPTRPPLAELTITPHGLVDVEIGRPVPEGDPAVQPYEWDGAACAASGVPEGEPWAGYWRAADSIELGGQQTAAFVFLTEGGVRDGVVSAIRVWGDVRTERGIAPRSAESELIAAYPGLEGHTPEGGVSTVYAYVDGADRLLFEVALETSYEYWPADVVGTVLWISAERNGPLYWLAGGDGGSPCIV